MPRKTQTLMALKDNTILQLVDQSTDIINHWFKIACLQSLDTEEGASINAQLYKRTSKINEPFTGHMITVKSVYIENGDEGEMPYVVFRVYDEMTEEITLKPIGYFTLDELLYLVKALQIPGDDPRQTE